MDDIIKKKFREWTEGLSPEKSLVKIFSQIRDIPYFIDLRLLDLANGPRGMLEDGKGSCTPKHYLMGMMYGRLGYKTRYMTYSFNWKDIGADYPKEVRDMADEIPVTYHLACKVLIDGKWLLIDATWDTPLAKAGFPVNKNWDGKSGTILAVKPVKEFIHDDAGERDRAFREKMASYTLTEKLELSRFTAALNAWLDKVRVTN